MSKVFADSDYWIALFHPNEQLHRRATECSRRLQRKRVVTTEMVMTEVLNYYSNQGAQLREAAAAWAMGLPKNGKITVIPQSSGQFHQAVQFYRQRRDKEWSLTDCASMLIMKEQSIVQALTFDHHFEQAGFRALLRDSTR
jgi:predicted nucleic acid-binding protein